METFDGYRDLAARRARLPAPAVAIGTFDGVHHGHRALLAGARAAANAAGGVAVAYTFDPHPTAVLAPHLAPPLLTTRARKLELLAAQGVDVTIVEPFTTELAAIAPADFVDQILVGTLAVRHVVIGWDFTYGQGRRGTPSTLAEHGARAGFTVEVVDKVLIDGEVASSTRIRGYLRGGDLARARRLLGRAYDVDGVVVHGAKRGRALGIPTANLQLEGDLLVPTGIYAGRLDGRDAVVSIGTNPTFVSSGTVTFEVHVLDWSGDLYDRRVRVELIARLREERTYASVDALLTQIRDDIRQARDVLASETRVAD